MSNYKSGLTLPIHRPVSQARGIYRSAMEARVGVTLPEVVDELMATLHGNMLKAQQIIEEKIQSDPSPELDQWYQGRWVPLYNQWLAFKTAHSQWWQKMDPSTPKMIEEFKGRYDREMATAAGLGAYLPEPLPAGAVEAIVDKAKDVIEAPGDFINKLKKVALWGGAALTAAIVYRVAKG